MGERDTINKESRALTIALQVLVLEQIIKNIKKKILKIEKFFFSGHTLLGPTDSKNESAY